MKTKILIAAFLVFVLIEGCRTAERVENPGIETDDHALAADRRMVAELKAELILSYAYADSFLRHEVEHRGWYETYSPTSVENAAAFRKKGPELLRHARAVIEGFEKNTSNATRHDVVVAVAPIGSFARIAQQSLTWYVLSQIPDDVSEPRIQIVTPEPTSAP